MLNWIVWNRTNYLCENWFCIKYPTKADMPKTSANQTTDSHICTTLMCYYFCKFWLLLHIYAQLLCVIIFANSDSSFTYMHNFYVLSFLQVQTPPSHICTTLMCYYFCKFRLHLHIYAQLLCVIIFASSDSSFTYMHNSYVLSFLQVQTPPSHICTTLMCYYICKFRLLLHIYAQLLCVNIFASSDSSFTYMHNSYVLLYLQVQTPPSHICTTFMCYHFCKFRLLLHIYAQLLCVIIFANSDSSFTYMHNSYVLLYLQVQTPPSHICTTLMCYYFCKFRLFLHIYAQLLCVIIFASSDSSFTYMHNSYVLLFLQVQTLPSHICTTLMCYYICKFRLLLHIYAQLLCVIIFASSDSSFTYMHNSYVLLFLQVQILPSHICTTLMCYYFCKFRLLLHIYAQLLFVIIFASSDSSFTYMHNSYVLLFLQVQTPPSHICTTLMCYYFCKFSLLLHIYAQLLCVIIFASSDSSFTYMHNSYVLLFLQIQTPPSHICTTLMCYYFCKFRLLLHIYAQLLCVIIFASSDSSFTYMHNSYVLLFLQIQTPPSHICTTLMCYYFCKFRLLLHIYAQLLCVIIFSSSDSSFTYMHNSYVLLFLQVQTLPSHICTTLMCYYICKFRLLLHIYAQLLCVIIFASSDSSFTYMHNSYVLLYLQVQTPPSHICTTLMCYYICKFRLLLHIYAQLLCVIIFASSDSSFTYMHNSYVLLYLQVQTPPSHICTTLMCYYFCKFRLLLHIYAQLLCVIIFSSSDSSFTYMHNSYVLLFLQVQTLPSHICTTLMCYYICKFRLLLHIYAQLLCVIIFASSDSSFTYMHNSYVLLYLQVQTPPSHICTTLMCYYICKFRLLLHIYAQLLCVIIFASSDSSFTYMHNSYVLLFLQIQTPPSHICTTFMCYYFCKFRLLLHIYAQLLCVIIFANSDSSFTYMHNSYVLLFLQIQTPPSHICTTLMCYYFCKFRLLLHIYAQLLCVIIFANSDSSFTYMHNSYVLLFLQIQTPPSHICTTLMCFHFCKFRLLLHIYAQLLCVIIFASSDSSFTYMHNFYVFSFLQVQTPPSHICTTLMCYYICKFRLLLHIYAQLLCVIIFASSDSSFTYMHNSYVLSFLQVQTPPSHICTTLMFYVIFASSDSSFTYMHNSYVLLFSDCKFRLLLHIYAQLLCVIFFAPPSHICTNFMCCYFCKFRLSFTYMHNFYVLSFLQVQTPPSHICTTLMCYHFCKFRLLLHIYAQLLCVIIFASSDSSFTYMHNSYVLLFLQVQTLPSHICTTLMCYYICKFRLLLHIYAQLLCVIIFASSDSSFTYMHNSYVLLYLQVQTPPSHICTTLMCYYICKFRLLLHIYAQLLCVIIFASSDSSFTYMHNFYVLSFLQIQTPPSHICTTFMCYHFCKFRLLLHIYAQLLCVIIFANSDSSFTYMHNFYVLSFLQIQTPPSHICTTLMCYYFCKFRLLLNIYAQLLCVIIFASSDSSFTYMHNSYVLLFLQVQTPPSHICTSLMRC